jgi:sulfite exporter TauE/SafE
MAAGDLTLAAAFIAGVSGSVHCMAMCGGLAGAFGMRARAHGGNARSAFIHASVYQSGRIASYMLAGALCGAFGGLLLHFVNLAGITLWLRVAAGLLLAMLGLQLALGWRLLRPVETAGAHIWRRLSPLAKHLPEAGLPQAFMMGMLWGWLPCGLVYSMLLLGVLGGSPAHGATLMLAFGIGTLPSMLSSSLLASQLARAASQQGLRASAGALMILFGVWTGWVALQHHVH